MPRSTDPVCDPVTLEIVRGAIRAAQAEMEALIERTAISAFIREKKDFYTALFDADGIMAVGSNLPVFGDICGPGVPRLPARDDAAGRPLLVQRLLRLARRGLPFQRPGAGGAGVPRRQALRLRHGLGAFLRHRRHARGLDQPRRHRHLPGRHHRSADQADRRRHDQRGDAKDLLSAIRASPSRTGATCARSWPRRRWACSGSRRSSRASAPTWWPMRSPSSSPARASSSAPSSPRPSATARTNLPTRSIRTATATARSISASR